MELKRKHFQGVLNIIRFNWHFYAFILILSGLATVLYQTFPTYQLAVLIILAGLITNVAISLIISWYVYDLSNLYQYPWLEELEGNVLIVNAGFDEISPGLKSKFEKVSFHLCDFYDPDKHTEPSIRRARKAFPPHPSTLNINTMQPLPFADSSFNSILATLSLHEIRSVEERVIFLKDVHRILRPEGKMYITEHLRDLPNFLAYSIGFFHFHSKRSWLSSFAEANFMKWSEHKTTPFITTFILQKNGNPL